jgi:hypothetical protein
MMTRWRSLFVTGAVLAAFALLAPTAAWAQPGAPTPVTATVVDWDSVRVNWTAVDDDAESWRIRYQGTDGAAALSALTLEAMVTARLDDDDVKASDATATTLTYTINGLKAGMFYSVTVTGIGEEDAVGTESAVASTTEKTPKPIPERVSGVMVEAGDRMLTVSWSATHPTTGDDTGLSTVEYHLQYRTTQTADASAGDWTPESDGGMTVMGTTGDITNLMNGTSYDVRVRAENNAGGQGAYSRVTADTRGMPMADGMMEDEDMEDEDMTETPALPLVGLLLLGAGLVAAGRRRLQQ